MSLGLVLALLIPAKYSNAGSTSNAEFTVKYDLDATEVTYCTLGPARALPGLVETSGSSVTTTEVADTDPFAGLAAGDILIASKDSTNRFVRSIITFTSASEVVVDAAWDLSADYQVSARELECGTGAENGWLDVGGFDVWAVLLEIDQMNVTGGIDVRIECRTGNLNASPVQVFPETDPGASNTYQNYDGTAGIELRTLTIGNGYIFQQCRVGIKIGTSDDGGDLTTNAERIDIGLVRYLVR